MTQITTHILDTARGEPAVGVAVTLAGAGDDRNSTKLATELTDGDGRIGSFPEVAPGRWRLIFATQTPLFPEIVVTFEVAAGRPHLHLPLLLSPYGYSVYRGS